jgi:hypothetical protein
MNKLKPHKPFHIVWWIPPKYTYIYFQLEHWTCVFVYVHDWMNWWIPRLTSNNECVNGKKMRLFARRWETRAKKRKSE